MATKRRKRPQGEVRGVPVFQRAGWPRGSRVNTRDAWGAVTVTVMLTVRQRTGSMRPVKGNIVRTFTARGARVSDVARIVEIALFGEVAELAGLERTP